MKDEQQKDKRIAELEAAMRKHRHTEECFDYAIKCASRGGPAYCIAKCKDSWREAKIPEV